MSNDSKVKSRPNPTPRVVNILTQLAFDRKEPDEVPDYIKSLRRLEEGSSYEPSTPEVEPEEMSLSLTQAKGLVAIEFGFDDWQHFKRLAKQYESIVRKRPAELRQDYVFKTSLDLYLDGEDRILDENMDEDEDGDFDGHATLDELAKLMNT